MTESLPHLNTIMKIFKEIFGVQIWKTPSIVLNLEIIKFCPNNWGVINQSLLTGAGSKQLF